MLLQVGRGRAQHLLQRGQPARHQPRVVQLGTQPQRHIETFADRIEQAVFHHQVQRQLRMLLQEAWQQRRQRAQRERLRRIDAQAPGHVATLFGDAAFQCVQLVEQAAAFAVIGVAGLGQAHAACGPLQQHHAQVGFSVRSCLLSLAGDMPRSSAARASPPRSTMRRKARIRLKESMPVPGAMRAPL
jgi:hypothetical protein